MINRWIAILILMVLTCPRWAMSEHRDSLISSVKLKTSHENKYKNKPDPAATFGGCRNSLAFIAGGLVAFTAVGIVGSQVVYPALYPEAYAAHGYELQAFVEGKEYIGLGIFYDEHKIFEKLSPSEWTALDRATVEPLVAAQLLASKLSGDYEDKLLNQPPTFAPKPRDASEFFKGESKKRGVCRHKALILGTILKKRGIDVRLEYGEVKGTVHAWVYLVKEKWVADPSSGRVEPADSYYFRFRTQPVASQKLEELGWAELSHY